MFVTIMFLITAALMVVLVYSVYKRDCDKVDTLFVKESLLQQLVTVKEDYMRLEDLYTSEVGWSKELQACHKHLVATNETFSSQMHKCPTCKTAMHKHWANKMMDKVMGTAK